MNWSELLLHPDHVEDLKKSGLNADTVKAAGIHSVCPADIPESLHGIKSAYKIPYPGCNGFARLKLFPPQNGMKYYQTPNSGLHLYIPNGFDRDGKVVFIAEGEKKCLKGLQEGLNIIGIGGIWNFAVKENGEPRLIDEFKSIRWQGKIVELVPDSDFQKNIIIRHAVLRLGLLLEAEGAKVRVSMLPSHQGEKVGLDDFLISHTVDEFNDENVVKRISLDDEVFEQVRLREGRVSYAKNTEIELPRQIKFPKDVIAGIAGDFANAYGEFIESPISFLYFSFLTCLGVQIADKVTIDSELKPQSRLYLVLVAESANDRKSTAIEITTRDFQEALTTQNPWICYGAGSAEGLALRLNLSRKMLLYVDELKSLIEKMKIQGAILLPAINTLFEGNRFHSATINHNLSIDDAYLSIIGACTVETFQNLFDARFLDIGFINRLFLVSDKSEKRFSIPQRIPAETKEELQKKLNDVLTWVDNLAGGGKYEMPIDADALKLFDDWYMAMPRDIYSKRLDSYGHRFMSLLAVNERKDKVDIEIMRKVILILNYEYAVRKLNHPVDAVNRLAELEEKIRRALQSGAMSKRNLCRALNYHRYGSHLWKWAINNLLESGEIGFINNTYYLRSDYPENDSVHLGNIKHAEWDGLRG